MIELIEALKNTFAVFGIICFSSMAIFSLLHMHDLVKMYGLKEGLKRWIYGH
jgi:hypothetical protein